MQIMNNRWKTIISVALALAGVAAFAWFLVGQSLDRAEKWISISGVVVSAGIGVAGLWLGWLTWRQSRRVGASPQVRATGAAATAIGGDNRGSIVGRTSGPASRPQRPGSASGDVVASGDSSTAIRGDNDASIHNEVIRDDPDGDR